MTITCKVAAHYEQFKQICEAKTNSIILSYQTDIFLNGYRKILNWKIDNGSTVTSLNLMEDNIFQ